jgi:sporulation protein YunB
MLPTAVSMTELKAAAVIAEIINDGVHQAVAERGITAHDFYDMTLDERGQIAALTVNAMLISKICSDLAGDITRNLATMPQAQVEVPFGVMTGVKSLANSGPMYQVKLMQMGAAEVDYSSSFTQAGINQTNFKIWVSANAQMRIVNPVQELTVTAERKILLVDVIINGAVPNWPYPIFTGYGD